MATLMAPPRPNRVVPPPAGPQQEHKGGGGLLLLMALGAGGLGYWYYTQHHCSPACGTCQACSGGHCTALCPDGQTCGPPDANGKPVCVPIIPPQPCPAGCTGTPPNCVCPQPPPGACDYTVRGGDILINIVQRAYGAYYFPAGQVIWEWVYNQNPQIKAIAESHGITSNWWHYIYPGEVIHLPVSPPGSGSSAAPNCNI